jgi:hypothetical protein
VYDGDSIKIVEGGGDKHTLNQPVGLDIEELKKLGYKNITVAMSIEIRAQDTGDRRNIWLDIDGSQVWKLENINVNNTSWYKITKTASVPISYFKDSSEFRFGFNLPNEGNIQYWLNDGIWFFNTADVTFTAVK